MTPTQGLEGMAMRLGEERSEGEEAAAVTCPAGLVPHVQPGVSPCVSLQRVC